MKNTMKKLTALFALLVLALSTASAAPDVARGVFEKTYDYKDFTDFMKALTIK